MTFITGPSGCGKSTLLRLLNATVLPTAGRIEYKGSPLGGLPVLDYRKQVLLAPQQVLSVRGQCGRPVRLFLGARGEECVSRAEMVNALEICRMPPLPRGQLHQIFPAASASGCFCPFIFLLGPRCCCWTSPPPRWMN